MYEFDNGAKLDINKIPLEVSRNLSSRVGRVQNQWLQKYFFLWRRTTDFEQETINKKRRITKTPPKQPLVTIGRPFMKTASEFNKDWTGHP
jgi:hypothetical protein